MFLPIEVAGAARLEAPTGRHVDIVAGGDRLTVDTPRWAELLLLAPRSLAARRRSIARAASSLEALGLRLDVNVAEQCMIAMGKDIQPTLLARLFQLGKTWIPLSSVVEIWREAQRQKR